MFFLNYANVVILKVEEERTGTTRI